MRELRTAGRGVAFDSGQGSKIVDCSAQGEIGIGKPDRQVFDLTLKRVGLPVESAVMVGDNLRTDIAGALAVGMNSVWINRVGKTNDDGIAPDFEIRGLNQLPSVLESLAK